MTALFGRYTEVTVGVRPAEVDTILNIRDNYYPNYPLGKTFDTGKYVDGKWREGLTINFEIIGESSDKSTDTYIEIYNMAPFRGYFGKDSPIIVKSGYLERSDIVFAGKVQEVVDRFEGMNRVTKFTCAEQQKEMLDVYINRKFTAGQRWSEIVRSLVEETALSIGYIPFSRFDSVDATFNVTADQSVRRWIDYIVKNKLKHKHASSGNMNWKWFIRSGKFYCLPKNFAFPTGLRVSYKTGLMSLTKSDHSSSQKTDDMFTMKMLLVPWVNKDTMFWMDHGDGTRAFYKVQSYKYLSSASEHVVEAEVKKVAITLEAWNEMRYGVPYEIPEEFGEEET